MLSLLRKNYPHDPPCPCFPGCRANSLQPVPEHECNCSRSKVIAWAERVASEHDRMVMAVATKMPGQSRVDTAVSYIEDAENRCSGPAQASENTHD